MLSSLAHRKHWYLAQYGKLDGLVELDGMMLWPRSNVMYVCTQVKVVSESKYQVSISSDLTQILGGRRRVSTCCLVRRRPLHASCTCVV